MLIYGKNTRGNNVTDFFKLREGKGKSRAQQAAIAISKKEKGDYTEEMDPTDHVKVVDGKFVVVDKNGKPAAKFTDREDAEKYAKQNHDELMQIDEARNDSRKYAMAAKEVKAIKDPIEGANLKKLAIILDRLGKVSLINSGDLLNQLNKIIMDLDTDVRELVFRILKKQDLMESLEEAKFSDKEVKMAIGIASDKRYAKGNMTGAVKAIEKMKKGLSKHPKVAAVLRRQNESLQEKLKVSDGIETWIKDFQDSDAPQFKGKDKEQRRKMAIAAFKDAEEEIKENVEDEMPASPDEASMAMKQAEFIMYVGREIAEHIQAGKEFPEWMQNKLSGLHQKAKDMHATLGAHGMNEEVELEEKYSWNDVNDALKKANYMRGNPAHINKVAAKFDYKSGKDKKFSLADLKKNLSAAGIDGAKQHNIMKHIEEEGGAGDEGTDALVKKYKKDTPMNESVEKAAKKIDKAGKNEDPIEIAAMLSGIELKDVSRNERKFMRLVKHPKKKEIFKAISDIQG